MALHPPCKHYLRGRMEIDRRAGTTFDATRFVGACTICGAENGSAKEVNRGSAGASPSRCKKTRRAPLLLSHTPREFRFDTALYQPCKDYLRGRMEIDWRAC